MPAVSAGKKVVAIDFDVGLRNLDLVMGCERRVVYDFVNVIRNEAKLHTALIRDKRVETLYVLPASQTRDKDALDAEGVGRVINEYQDQFQRGDFLVRNVLGLDRDSGALAITDRVRVGQTVQFHVRDANTADEDLHELLQLHVC